MPYPAVGIGLTALFSPKVLCWFSEINILILKYWIGEKEIGLLGGSEGRNYCLVCQTLLKDDGAYLLWIE